MRLQLSFTNSTEVLFAVLTFYQLRVVERIWGSRKFAVRIPSPIPSLHPIPHTQRIQANKPTVLPPFHPPLHNPPPTPHPNLHPPPPNPRPHEPPPRRPNPPPLRPPRKLLRRNPIHLPLQNLSLGRRLPINAIFLHALHNADVEILVLPAPLTTRAIPVPWELTSGGGGVGGWNGV